MNKKGYSLIEVLVAITFLTVLITAPMSIISNYLIQNKKTTEYVHARFYAQEILEYTRHLRDTNFLNLSSADWLSGELTGCLSSENMSPPEKHCLAVSLPSSTTPIKDDEDIKGFHGEPLAYSPPLTSSNSCGGDKSLYEDRKFVRTLELVLSDPEARTVKPPTTVTATACVGWYEIDREGKVKYVKLKKQIELFRWIIK